MITDDRPNPSAPVTCRLRMRYAKRQTARFTSHRDVARAFERALRRAGVPVGYSQGFSPHPKLSWIGAAPTGASSEAEYVEIGLVRQWDPHRMIADLQPVLPRGLSVMEVVTATAEPLSERIDGSAWHIEFPGVGTERLERAVEAVRATESIEIERMTKKGRRMVDVRPAILSLSVAGTGDPGTAGAYGILEAVVRQTTPTVRPDDVLSALRVVAALTPPVAVKATRTAQGRIDDACHLVDPFVPDRAAGPSAVAGEP